ncbi:MAG: hypothetical protein HUK05_03710, partial [Prevotella sp.]|nr:hypothetical protein [Prevotella sp.]
GTKLWNDVLADKNYADIRDNEDLVASEVKSRLSGKDGEKLLEDLVKEADEMHDPIEKAQRMALVARIKALLSQMWDETKRWFADSNAFTTKYTKEQLLQMKAEDFIRKTLKDLAEGVNPTEYGKGEYAQYRFVGEKGAANADKAEGTTVRMDNLKVAEEMEKQYKELHGSEKHKQMVEASKRVRSMNATPLDDIASDRDKKSLVEKIQSLKNGENVTDGRKVRFVNSIAGKLLGHKGFDYSLIVPKLKELYDTSVPAFSEEEIKKDGHTDHSSNFVGYHHYINKVSLGGNDYYVRFTVQEKKTRKADYIPNEMHSSHITSVEIYNANSIETSGIIDPAQMT